MKTIYTRCPHCDEEVALRPDRVALLRATDVLYGFACPACETPVVKPADGKAVRLLQIAGVSQDGPVEPLRPSPTQDGDRRPLTYDDLLDLHLLLEGHDWLERIAPSADADRNAG